LYVYARIANKYSGVYRLFAGGGAVYSCFSSGVFVKERLARLKAVRKLIKTYRIESQETLLGYLQQEGFVLTQATLSRDLKLLKVGKISDGHNGYI
jgi:hypothetical protein